MRPSSGCKLVMTTRTLSFPFHAISVSACDRTTASLSSVAVGFGVNRLDVKTKGVCVLRAQTLHSGFITHRDGRPTFDGFKEHSACCSQQMVAACSLHFATKRSVSYTQRDRKEHR